MTPSEPSRLRENTFHDPEARYYFITRRTAAARLEDCVASPFSPLLERRSCATLIARGARRSCCTRRGREPQHPVSRAHRSAVPPGTVPITKPDVLQTRTSQRVRVGLRSIAARSRSRPIQGDGDPGIRVRSSISPVLVAPVHVARRRERHHHPGLPCVRQLQLESALRVHTRLSRLVSFGDIAKAPPVRTHCER